MIRFTKNVRLWCILALVPILLSFLIVGYAKYKYEDQTKTAAFADDDWEPDERENERIARREVLDAEENRILLNLDGTDSVKPAFLTPEYIEAEVEMAMARSGVQEADLEPEVAMVEDEQLAMDEDGNPVIYEVSEGEWLASIALKLYGSKAFWGYIYEVNHDMLHSPRDVMAGIELYLPNIEYYHIDSNNIQSVQKAAKVSAAYLNEQ